MNGHVCVQLDPQPVPERASESRSAPSWGKDRVQCGYLLEIWSSKLDKEAINAGRGPCVPG